MRRIFLLAIWFALWPLGCESQSFVQDEVHFRKAILINSSSPYFVFIEVIDVRKNDKQSFCIEAPFLLGALHREFNLGYDMFTIKKVIDIALSNADHAFRFSKQEALDNMPVRYTQAEFDQARKMINMFGVAPLMQLLSEKRKQFGKLQWSPALACALSEKGLSARRADITGQIYAEP